MTDKIKILLQATIPFDENDWHIGRFSLVRDHLASIIADDGEPMYEITSRNREPDPSGDDPFLVTVDERGFDEIWLTAADFGNGLTETECEAVSRFRKNGGGILSTRDHQDLGASLCSIYGIGRANYFNSTNPEPDEARRIRDDQIAINIDFPNYHSGRNGDAQVIETPIVDHPLILRRDGSPIKYFPAHPHEGAVGAPSDDPSAAVIARGKSLISGASFDLVVAFDGSSDFEGNQAGRAIVHSSFHHFADYNWDPATGCPNFVEEPPGDGFARHPERLDDFKIYVENLGKWLAPRNIMVRQ